MADRAGAELTITGIGAAGDGIVPGPIFVPGALPGEHIDATIQGRRGDAQVARLDSILLASPDRIAPPCIHVSAGCGGCVTQHWSGPAAAAWKRDRLIEALSRAGFPDAPVAPTVTVPPGTRRRADFAIRRARDGAVTVGLHLRGSGDVLAIPDCLVLDPRLVALMAPLAAMLRGLQALRREGSAIVNLLDDGADILLRTDGALDAVGRSLLAGFAEAHHLPRIAWATRDGPMEIAAQRGPARLHLSGVEVLAPPGAFLQAVPAGEAAIIQAVLAGLPEKLTARARVAELYAGLGTLSFPLAQRAAIASFEGDAAAAAALAAAAARAGLRITATRRDLARQPLSPAELAPFVAVVLDPPFAGAAEQMAAIARAKVKRVIAVSCNPVALARDARALSGAGYRVLAATPIDQFLWSAQLEAVVVFGL